MKIVVLAGGLSPERGVSLTSGSLIAGALVRNGHEVCAVDLYTGRALGGNTPTFTREPIPALAVDPRVPDLDDLMLETGRGECRIGEGVMDLCRAADAVFIALHGDVGENGQLQAALDMEGIPYTGSGYAGSCMAMDKDVAKQLMVHAGIPTPPWLLCATDRDAEQTADKIMATVGLPCVIKPLSCGSSVGVSMPGTREELISAIRLAATYEDRIMAERLISGREVTVSIMNGEVLPVVEIIPHEGFYDYQNKYQSGKTEEVCPAELDGALTRKLSELTRQGFDALHLRDYARFDYMIDQGGEPWCLEANTLPGMTPTSLLPLAAATAGVPYDELCERMIRMALGRA